MEIFQTQHLGRDKETVLGFLLSYFSHLLYSSLRTSYVASVISDCAVLWTVARQAPLSMGVSRQEYWSGLPCSPPGNLPDLD